MSVGRLARAAAVVAVFGLLSRALGFVREVVISGAYGTTGAADAFVSALFLVNTVAAVLLYTLVTLVIPAFQQEREGHGERSAWALAGAIAGWVGIVLIALAGAIGVWPEAFARLFALDGARGDAAVELLRIMAPAAMLQGFSALATALLQIHGRFAGPAAVGVVFNLSIISAIAVGQGSIGIEAAAWGVSAGAVLQVLLQLPQLVRLVRGTAARPRLRHPRLRATWLLALPVLGASLLQQINGFTDKLFANTLDEGRTAALSYANALGSAPRTALLFPLLTPLFPVVAGMLAKRRDADAVAAFTRAAGLLALVAAPMTALIALYPQEITQVAFGRGKCGADCVEHTSAPLLFYGLAIWPNFLGYLVNRTLAAASATRAILVATAVGVPLTIALDLALLGPMEQAGLALASAVAVYVTTTITLVQLRRRLPDLSLRTLAGPQVRLVACAAVATGAALVLDQAVPSGDGSGLRTAALLGVKVAVFAAVFAVAARLLARRELAEAGRVARSLRNRRRRAPLPDGGGAG
ncbi:MAG: lipid II flippase MurJ [Actinomycetota bacterium]